jgi:hypothetical protein
MKIRWVILAGVALASVSCSKQQPREVRELRLDDKVIDLKADAFDALMSRAKSLCDFAGFLGASLKAQRTGAPHSNALSGASVVSSSSMISEEETSGNRMLSSRTSMALNDAFKENIQRHGHKFPGKPISPQVLNEVRTLLDATRSGWRVAVLYQSDTASEASVSSFASYTYRKITISSTSIDCVDESKTGDRPRPR